MSYIALNEISFSYEEKRVLDSVSFCIEERTVACLVGPSGSGKTTVLRLVAGFLRPESGEIQLAGRCIASPKTHIPPEERQVGMVFQDLSLFPHLNVFENIVFGLNRQTKGEKKERVAELLRVLDIEAYQSSYPSQLSGGQQQRVALARALAPRPNLLLLDEPFSQIDPELREVLVPELANLLHELKITALLVTHDQNEAFQIADKVGVLNRGKLCQWGSPYELYHQPSTEFVADFVGQGAFVQGRAMSSKLVETAIGQMKDDSGCFSTGASLKVLIRPDDLVFDKESKISGKILAKHFRGPYFLYRLGLSNGEQVLAAIPSHINLAVGEQLPIRFDAKHAVVFRLS